MCKREISKPMSKKWFTVEQLIRYGKAGVALCNWIKSINVYYDAINKARNPMKEDAQTNG